MSPAQYTLFLLGRISPIVLRLRWRYARSRRIGPFVARPGIDRQPTAWRDAGSGALVDLLTPNEGPDRDEPMELPALGAHTRA